MTPFALILPESLANELDRRRADDRRLRDSDRLALHAPAAARLAGVHRLPDRRAAPRVGTAATRALRRCTDFCSASWPTRSRSSGFGAAALGMAIVGFGASWLKAVFFADNLALNGFFLFLGEVGV